MVALILAGMISSLLPNSAMAQTIPSVKDANKSTIVGKIKTLDNRLAQSLIQVTGVRVNSNDKGIEVILQTTASNNLQISSKAEENYLIADIPNAQLRFPSGSTSFIQMNPGEGIEMVTAINTANGIRVKVKGKTAAPAVELFDGDEGLILSVISIKASATEQLPSAPIATNPTENIIELSVSGERIAPVTGSKTDTPVRDVPASIQIVSQDTIKDQGASNVDQSIRNVSGVTQSSTSNYGFSNVYSIRGLGQSFLRDGITDGSTVNGYSRTLTDVERVEVLKGPGSALYGSLSPGGSVNLVTKRPQETQAGSVKQTFGSFSNSQTTVDVTGAVTNDKKLLYRFNGSFQQKDGYRGLRNELLEIIPKFTWKPNDTNTINLDFDYRHIEVLADTYGIPFIGRELIKVPRDTRYYTPFANNIQDI
jgi:iron complex outermembrane receptor protein